MPILAAQLLVQLVTWPLVAALGWRAARGKASPVAWVVVVLLAAYAATTLVETTAVAWSRGLFAVMGVTVVLLFGLYPDGRFTPRWIVVPVSIEIALQAINVASGFSARGTAVVAMALPRHVGRDPARRPGVPISPPLVGRGARTDAVANAGRVGDGVRVHAVGDRWRRARAWPGARAVAWAFCSRCSRESASHSAYLRRAGLNVDVALRWCLLLGCSSVTLGTAILATMALGEGLGASAQERTWMAAAVAAALTIPVVGVSRRAADRFVYGRRPSPLRALEELGTRLAQLADPRDVPETVLRAVTESLAVGGARLLVGDTVQAEVGTATFEEQFPITYRDERLATLAVSPRPGETTLIARDRSVITRICALAGPALHGARLVNELVEARARVVIAREDERRRLRRDLHDDLAPTLAGLGLSAAVVEKFSRAGDPRAADAATDLAGRLQGASRQVRDIAYNLRPPVLDDRGLVAAIEETIASAAALPR